MQALIKYKTIDKSSKEEYVAEFQEKNAADVELVGNGVLVTGLDGWKEFFPNNTIVRASWR